MDILSTMVCKLGTLVFFFKFFINKALHAMLFLLIKPIIKWILPQK